MDEEVSLPAGGTNVGIVRVGDTVRRPPGPNAEYARAILRLFEERNVPAPRFLGIDDRGRDILSYLEGDAAHGRNEWSDAQLSQIALLVRAMHDATLGHPLAERAEIVCHNDLAPWNLVVDPNTPVAFIDFDDAAPGNRLDDLGYLLWTFLELGSDLPPDLQARRMATVCEAYGLTSSSGLIEAILAQQARVLDWRQRRAQTAESEDIRRFSDARVLIVRSDIEWVRRYRDVLSVSQ